MTLWKVGPTISNPKSTPLSGSPNHVRPAEWTRSMINSSSGPHHCLISKENPIDDWRPKLCKPLDGGPYGTQSPRVHHHQGRPWVPYQIHGPDHASSGPTWIPRTILNCVNPCYRFIPESCGSAAHQCHLKVWSHISKHQFTEDEKGGFWHQTRMGNGSRSWNTTTVILHRKTKSMKSYTIADLIAKTINIIKRRHQRFLHALTCQPRRKQALNL